METYNSGSAYLRKGHIPDDGQAGSGYLATNNSDKRYFKKPGVNGRSGRISPDDSVLGGLSSELYKNIEPFVKRIPLSREQYLFQQDDNVEFVYFPETAVVSEFQMLQDGRTIEVAVTGGEGAVGISSVLSAYPAVNCAQVCVAGTALKIDSRILEKELTFNRQMQRWLNDRINTYIRQISQKAICNAHHGVEERFCSWLLMLQDRSKCGTFYVTHEYIAGVLGVYRPSVTCIAKTLRERGVIDYVRGRISITDRAKLKQNCCACYSEPAMAPQPDRRTDYLI